MAAAAEKQDGVAFQPLDLVLGIGAVVTLGLIVWAWMTWANYAEVSTVFPERREALEDLFETEARVKSVLESAGADVIAISADRLGELNTDFEKISREDARMNQGSLSSVRPSGEAIKGDFKESKVLVKFKNVSVEQLIKFIFAVERKIPGLKTLRVSVPGYGNARNLERCEVQFAHYSSRN
jgi:hypothetical protein